MTKTTKIERFDGTTCRAVAKAMEEALKPVGERYGLSIQFRGGRYQDTSYSPKVVCAIVDDGGTVQGPEVSDFKRYANLYGLKPDDLGREFRTDRGVFVLTGLKSRARRFPLLGKEKATGKVYKFTADVVVAALEKAS
jgi:hypothetical protein